MNVGVILLHGPTILIKYNQNLNRAFFFGYPLTQNVFKYLKSQIQKIYLSRHFGLRRKPLWKADTKLKSNSISNKHLAQHFFTIFGVPVPFSAPVSVTSWVSAPLSSFHRLYSLRSENKENKTKENCYLAFPPPSLFETWDR